MRLHLPKTLLAAVLAACAALPAGATITETTLTSLTVQGATLPTAPEGQTTVYKQAVNEPATGEDTENEIPSALEPATATFLSGTNATRVFKVLNSSTVGNAGTLVIAKATVNGTESNAGQLHLSRWSKSTGYVDSGLEIANDLIIGETAAGNAIRLSDANSDVRLITLTGTITLAQNAQIGVDSTVTSGHGKITGSISGAGRTLTIASGGNKSGVLNLGDGTSGKTLTLGGLTVADATSVVMNYETATIGTLTLNSSSTSAALTLTGSGTTTITSLVTSGSVLDASGMEGTLTISGAKWTGNLTVDSVEVLKAKDADTATSLANSMNTTRGISYSFSATDTSVYRVLRTDSLTGLTAKLQGASGSRIVVDATYDNKTFTNVGLNELLAGDKVTIDGLTGWIGDNTSNSILADLEFTGQNHINNGSSSNSWITYSGAITGDGTLSYEWSGANYTYNFNGDLSGFTGTISDTTTLNVTIGGTLAEGVSNAVKATIDIAGALTVNRDATFTNTVQAGDNIKVTSGVFRVEKSASTNKELDLSAANNSTGCVEIASGASLTVGTNIWGRSNDTFASKILLEKGANLVWNGFTITGKTAKDGVETGLKFGANNVTLDSNNSAHSVTNSVITSTGTKTLSWTLTDTDLDVKSGTLRLGADVNAANVTVRNGSTLELVSGWKQELSSSNTTWESGAKLRYVSTDAVSLDVGTVGGSTIELYGVTGTLNAASSAIKGDIVLTNNGQDAAAKFETISGTSYTFDGKVKGGGNLLLNEANKTTNLNFNGNLSEWVSGSEDYSGLYVMAGTVNATIGVTEGNTLGDNSVANSFNAASGAQLNLTIDRDAVLTNKVNITSLAVNDGKTLSLSSDNKAVAVGSTTVGDKAKLVIGNKGEGTSIDLGTVSGSGTISSERTATQSVTLGTGADNAFTGTLEATAGKLSVTATAQQTLSGLKAKGGNIDVLSTTTLTVSDVVLGDAQTINVYSDTSSAGTLSVSEGDAAGITVGQGSSMKANLTLGEGAGMSFNVAGLTGAAGEAAICTLTGSLTLGLNVELHLLNLGILEEGKSITLFTGVTGFTYSGATSVATLSDDDISNGVDASHIFGNVDSGFFTVKFVGNDVILTASSTVPEPTTATLSLLALMGLAARRRRRKA